MFTRNGAVLGSAFLLAGVLPFSTPRECPAQMSRDFRFGEPHVSLAFNMGYRFPTAGSDIYDQLVADHTLDKKDFQALVVGGTFGLRLSNRLEASFDLSYANSNTQSEYREWVDQDDLPIIQNTSLTWMPMTGSLRVFLWDRGRRISNLAWVPTQWTPYVGGGGGWVYYKLRQAGDFVDFQTYEIFSDVIRSDGYAGTFHLLAGAEWSIGPSFYLTGEGRYSWADADLDQNAFYGFQPIDLSGFHVTAGIAVRF